MGLVKVSSSFSNNFKLKIIVEDCINPTGIYLLIVLCTFLPFPKVSGATFICKTNSIFQALKCCAYDKEAFVNSPGNMTHWKQYEI